MLYAASKYHNLFTSAMTTDSWFLETVMADYWTRSVPEAVASSVPCSPHMPPGRYFRARVDQLFRLCTREQRNWLTAVYMRLPRKYLCRVKLVSAMAILYLFRDSVYGSSSRSQPMRRMPLDMQQKRVKTQLQALYERKDRLQAYAMPLIAREAEARVSLASYQQPRQSQHQGNLCEQSAPACEPATAAVGETCATVAGGDVASIHQALTPDAMPAAGHATCATTDAPVLPRPRLASDTAASSDMPPYRKPQSALCVADVNNADTSQLSCKPGPTDTPQPSLCSVSLMKPLQFEMQSPAPITGMTETPLADMLSCTRVHLPWTFAASGLFVRRIPRWLGVPCVALDEEVRKPLMRVDALYRTCGL
jgi:hypothetical protein